jgi:catechol 2,3-dioxygenase-like lactoylglutathione lyase family enzyme
MTAPAVRGLNHVTLAVTDLARSVAFYRDGLGMALRAEWAGGAYLEAGALWLCLALDPRGGPRGDDTHVAFDVAAGAFDALGARARAWGPEWRENRSEGRSLYLLDPDGHRLELHVGTLASRLAHYAAHPPEGYVAPGPSGRA